MYWQCPRRVFLPIMGFFVKVNCCVFDQFFCPPLPLTENIAVKLRLFFFFLCNSYNNWVHGMWLVVTYWLPGRFKHFSTFYDKNAYNAFTATHLWRDSQGYWNYAMIRCDNEHFRLNRNTTMSSWKSLEGQTLPESYRK